MTRRILPLPDADYPCLTSVARLQRLAHRLAQAPAMPRAPFARPEPRPRDYPTFAEMMAVVERRGRNRLHSDGTPTTEGREEDIRVVPA